MKKEQKHRFLFVVLFCKKLLSFVFVVKIVLCSVEFHFVLTFSATDKRRLHNGLATEKMIDDDQMTTITLVILYC